MHINRQKAWLFAAVATLVLIGSGCGISPHYRAGFTSYDFGPPRPAVTDRAISLRERVSVRDVECPSWLDSPALIYRLAYDDVARVHTYGDSRWVATPAELTTLRLRQAIIQASSRSPDVSEDKTRASYELRVDLEEFSQVFRSPLLSQGQIQMRANLIDLSNRKLIAQRTFATQHAAPTPDAAGAVSALTEATDELIASILEWLTNRSNLGTDSK